MIFQPIPRTFDARSEDLHTCRRNRYDEKNDGAETMKFQHLRRPFDIQSEDLLTRRRYIYDEESDGAETMMFKPLRRPFDTRSENLPTCRRYSYDEERDGAETMKFQLLRRSFHKPSENLPTCRRYRYVEESDGAETMKFKPLRMSFHSRSEDLHSRRRYRYDEESDGDETIKFQTLRMSLHSRSEDLHTRRRYKYDEESDGDETMKFQPLRRSFHTRSENLHIRRRYRYDEESDEDETMKFEPLRRSFHTRSENLHTHRRYSYDEERDGETMMFQHILRPLDTRSEDLLTRRGYRYDEESDGEITLFQPIMRPVDTRSEDLLTRRRYRYDEESDGDQRRSHTILRSECLQAHKRYGYVEKDQIDAASRPSVEFLYWKANHFEHFDYAYSLVRDCKTRVAKLLKNNDPAYQMPEDVIVKIGIVGHHAKDYVNLIAKRPGKSKLLENQCIWSALPLVCFENDSTSKSKLKENTLRQEGVCHKIFIRSDTFCDKADKDEDEDDDSIISVGQDKDQIQDIITSCLEEPLQKMLQQLRKDLKRGRFFENASDIIAEIEAISNELIPINSKDTDVPISGSKSIVPDNVKDFLFRRPDVNSFGIWNASVFKVFVRKTTDFKVLKDELIMLNKNFFQQYDLEIEKMKTEMQTLMREDNMTGALTGFVIETNNHQKMCAWTCNHLIPRENEHFAAVEIKECYPNSCDVAFVKDNKKKFNANFYSNSLQTGGSVYKKEQEQIDVTNGRIVRPEFYLKATDKSNQENTFLLKGIAEKFFERGNSGLLVFSRPNRI